MELWYSLSEKAARQADMDNFISEGQDAYLVPIRGWNILVTHGSPSGMIHAIDSEGGYTSFPSRLLVVCCHPAAAKRRHPELRVIGTWEGESWASVEYIDTRPYLCVRDHSAL